MDERTIAPERNVKHAQIARKAVYIARAGAFCKIGISHNISVRMSQLRIHSPTAVKLYGTYQYDDAKALEKAVHAELADRRRHGEWFRIGAQEAERVVCRTRTKLWQESAQEKPQP